MGITFHGGDWAIVLGGSSGFGLATAQKLARHGMNVAIIHRDRKGSMALVDRGFAAIRETGVRLVTHNGDALAAETRRSFLGEVTAAMAPGDRIRLLLHSIAHGNLKPLVPRAFSTESRGLGTATAEAPELPAEACLDEEDFARTIYAMGTSLAAWTQDIFTLRLFGPSARVIGLTSEGNEVAFPSYAAVSAAKGALEAVCRSIAVELAPYGVRANVVQPGVTDTAALAKIPGSQHMKAAARLRNPCGRLTTPADVADVICLLCTEEAAWVNGAVIRVDGGERIGG